MDAMASMSRVPQERSLEARRSAHPQVATGESGLKWDVIGFSEGAGALHHSLTGSLA
jgi:hypothetical protein